MTRFSTKTLLAALALSALASAAGAQGAGSSRRNGAGTAPAQALAPQRLDKALAFWVVSSSRVL